MRHMTASKTDIDDDDKYAKPSMKAAAPSVLTKYEDEDVIKVPTYIFAYACFVLASYLAFTEAGLIQPKEGILDYQRFVVLQLEILGLVNVRAKIKSQKSVSGLSATTFLTYAAVYLGRTLTAFMGDLPYPWDPKFHLSALGLDPVLGFCSFLLVLDILKYILISFRQTYDAEFEKIKIWQIIPGCCVMALLIHVWFPEWTPVFRFFFTSVLYMDVMALMPQVVMMAMSGGKVATPVANFVAATAISRCGDLAHTLISVWNEYSANVESYEGYTLAEFPQMLNPSTWLVIIVQFFHLVLVADFMYYYCKSQTWAAKEQDEITLYEV